MVDLPATTKSETLIITVCLTEFHIIYMADLSGTTKSETLMITVCWTEFHINICENPAIFQISFIKGLIAESSLV